MDGPRRRTQQRIALADSAAAEDPRELEVSVRLASVKLGLVVSLIATLGVVVYIGIWPDHPQRNLLLGLAAASILGLVPIALMPAERIMRSRSWEAFFVAWSIADLIVISAVVVADGGLGSPLILMVALPLLVGSLSYPLRSTLVVGLIGIGALVGIAIYSGDDAPLLAVAAFGFFCIALMSAWASHNQTARTNLLAESIRARTVSQAKSRLQALEQQEVARFGQLALSGAELATIYAEVLNVLERVLEVNIGLVVELDSDRDRFRLLDSVGLRGASRGADRLADDGLPATRAIESNLPVLVSDWKLQTELKRPPEANYTGVRSSLVVGIVVDGEAFGALEAHSVKPDAFSADDGSFMQALANVLGSAIDRRQREDQMRHDALHDPLTGLANRTLFVDRLGQALARARRGGSSLAVLFVDLDDFKFINDSLGHDAGDELLRMIGARLGEAIRVTDTVARFGGDEFTVLVEEVVEEFDARLAADRILASFGRDFQLRGRTHHVRASVGIAIGAGDSSPQSLLRDADSALYHAKATEPGSSALFDVETRDRVIERVSLEGDLRVAVAEDQLELHYQPVVDLRSGRIDALEALVRWNHPTRGQLGPDAFIPLAEETRLIDGIGRWVVEESCRAIADWRRRQLGDGSLSVSVNLSTRQLADADFPLMVVRTMEANAITPMMLQFELTESLLFDETPTSQTTLNALTDLGVGLVLDDFGTGFSSLGYLKRLPLDAIKLDRSFVAALGTASPDAAIVTATVHLADALQLAVVAEGIETNVQLDAVRELGCRYAQGNLLSPPVPADMVPAVISALAPTG